MFVRQKSSNVMMFWMDMLVLWYNVGSCSNFCCIVCMEGSTGTKMKRVLVSYDVITSPCSSLTFCMC